MAQNKNIIYEVSTITGKSIRSLAELERATKELEKELKRAGETGARFGSTTSADFLKAKEAVKQAKAEILTFNRELRQSASLAQRVQEGVTASFKKIGVAGLALFAVSSVGDAFSKASKDIREFEKTISELSSITGAAGEDLEFLRQKAIEFGRTTTVSARDAAEAFKLIASAKPELLENGVALAEVAKQAIILAEASGLELPDAATRLTDALNQFNAPAEEAGRYINILAEGSKLGSAEVPQITEALLEFGAVARTSNVSIAESTALIETLAEKGLKGAEAGTALRNVLIKISAPDALPKRAQEAFARLGIDIEKAANKNLTLNERLDILKPLLNDSSALVEIFGTENVVAATNILQNTDRVKELTEALSKEGLTTATEQARIATDNLDGDLKRLDNTINAITVSQSGLNQLMRGFIQNADILIQAFDRVFDSRLRASERWSAFFSQGEELLMQNEKAKKVQEKLNSLTLEYVNTSEKRGKLVDALVAAGFKESAAADIVLQKYFELEKQSKNVNTAKKENTAITNENTYATNENTYATDKNNKSKEKEVRVRSSNVQAIERELLALDKFIQKIEQKTSLDLRGEQLTEEEQKRQAIIGIIGYDPSLAPDAKRFADEALQKQIDRYQKSIFYINTYSNALRDLATLEGVLTDNKIKDLERQNATEEQIQAVRKKSFQRQKALNMAITTANTAAAIVAALAPPPSGLGPVYGAPVSVAAGITGALQLASIAAQKFAKGGIVEGKSHAQGGEKFAVGGRVVELEGGEAVINKRSTAMFAPILSAINSVNGWGKKFEAGGILPNNTVRETPQNILMGSLLNSFENINFTPTVSVVEINRMQQRVNVIENMSKI